MRFQLGKNPLDCLLSILRSDVWVDAFVSQIVDVRNPVRSMGGNQIKWKI